MAIDKATKDSIIIAAITAAGPVGDDAETWDANVLHGVRRITAILANTESDYGKAIDEIDTSKKFVALLSLVKKEATSKRGVAYFQDAPKLENGVFGTPQFTYEQILAVHLEQEAARAAGKKGQDLPKLPEGLEAIRTDRTEGKDGLFMAKEATALVGHRVLVYKVMEPVANHATNKARVLKHLDDLGPIDTYVVPVKPVAVAAAA